MKALIVISRTYENEFQRYDAALKAIHKQYKDIDFLLIDGFQFFRRNPDTSEREFKYDALEDEAGIILNQHYQETIVAIHHNLHFNDVQNNLKGNFNQAKWGKLIIKEYSGKGNESKQTVYKDYLIPLSTLLNGATKDDNQLSELSEKLYLFFWGDPIFEAKLQLLHQCLLPEKTKNILWEAGEVTMVIDEKTLTEEIGTKGVNAFKDLQNIKDGPFGTEYIKALTVFRNALLEEY